MVGRQTTGKRLGILGMGRVGQVVAQRARGFDMTIHYHNRKPLDSEQAGDAIYYPSVEALLENIDVLSIHCPAMEATRGLINHDRLALMHADSILVNTSRGGSEAIHSNQAIALCIKHGLDVAGLPTNAVQVVKTTDRAAVGELLRMKDNVDVIIPRGGDEACRPVAFLGRELGDGA